MALSWRNLPCALKAAIGYGKWTLGNPRRSGAPQGAAARPLRMEPKIRKSPLGRHKRSRRKGAHVVKSVFRPTHSSGSRKSRRWGPITQGGSRFSSPEMRGGVERLTLDVTRTLICGEKGADPEGCPVPSVSNQEPGRTSNKEGESGRCYLLRSPESSGIGSRARQPGCGSSSASGNKHYQSPLPDCPPPGAGGNATPRLPPLDPAG